MNEIRAFMLPSFGDIREEQDGIAVFAIADQRVEIVLHGEQGAVALQQVRVAAMRRPGFLQRLEDIAASRQQLLFVRS